MRRTRRGASFGGSRWAAPAALATAAFAAAGPGYADEPMFGYVNTTDLLPKSKLQIEQWATLREADAAGDFRLLEGRTEVDYGLSDNLQVTAYLNYSHLRADLRTPQDQAFRLQPVGRLSRARIDGATAEAIWRIWSPYLQPVGLALLVDGTTGRGQGSLGLKAIAQKNFRDDTVVLAANVRVDVGRRAEARTPAGLPSRRSVTPVEVSLGASYRFRPNWSLALELRSRSQYAGSAFSGGRRETQALYLGPSLHYGAQRWFFTLTALPRIDRRHRAPAAGQIVDSLAYAQARTRLDGVRLRIGRTF